MEEPKGRLVLSKDEWTALAAIHDAETLGQQTSKELRFSVRLLDLGLIGRNAHGRLAITPWGDEALRRSRPQQVDRIYTRKKGLRRTYEYSAIWGEGEQSPWWSAVVRHDGEFKGRLDGNLLNPLTPTPETVISMVESSIENLLQIQE